MKKNKPQFKIGKNYKVDDKVRVISDYPGGCVFKKGYIGYITEIDVDVYRLDNKDCGWVISENIELIKSPRGRKPGSKNKVKEEYIPKVGDYVEVVECSTLDPDHIGLRGYVELINKWGSINIIGVCDASKVKLIKKAEEVKFGKDINVTTKECEHEFGKWVYINNRGDYWYQDRYCIKCNWGERREVK